MGSENAGVLASANPAEPGGRNRQCLLDPIEMEGDPRTMPVGFAHCFRTLNLIPSVNLHRFSSPSLAPFGWALFGQPFPTFTTTRILLVRVAKQCGVFACICIDIKPNSINGQAYWISMGILWRPIQRVGPQRLIILYQTTISLPTSFTIWAANFCVK